MKYYLLKTLCVLTLLSMTSCTYTVSMAHTSGTADDVIDDTSDPDFTPTVTVPLTPGSSIGISK